MDLTDDAIFGLQGEGFVSLEMVEDYDLPTLQNQDTVQEDTPTAETETAPSAAPKKEKKGKKRKQLSDPVAAEVLDAAPASSEEFVAAVPAATKTKTASIATKHPSPSVDVPAKKKSKKAAKPEPKTVDAASASTCDVSAWTKYDLPGANYIEL